MYFLWKGHSWDIYGLLTYRERKNILPTEEIFYLPPTFPLEIFCFWRERKYFANLPDYKKNSQVGNCKQNIC